MKLDSTILHTKTCAELISIIVRLKKIAFQANGQLPVIHIAEIAINEFMKANTKSREKISITALLKRVFSYEGD